MGIATKNETRKIDGAYAKTVEAYLKLQRHHDDERLLADVDFLLDRLKAAGVRRPDWFNISDSRGQVDLCWESQYDETAWPRRKLTAMVRVGVIDVHLERKDEAYSGSGDSARFSGLDVDETVSLMALLIGMNDRAKAKKGGA